MNEVDSTKAAIKEAIAEDADLYCTKMLDSAQALLDSALAEIEKQKKTKIPFMRIYKRANRLLNEAKDLANSTKNCVKENKEIIQAEIRKQVKQAESEIDRIKKDVLVPPLVKKEDKFKSDLDSAVSLLALAKDAITNNDFRGAKKRVVEVNEILNSILLESANLLAVEELGKKY